MNSPRKDGERLAVRLCVLWLHEAAVNSPRKDEQRKQNRQGRVACFNEAAVNSPRKVTADEPERLRGKRFNEAAVNSPRKGPEEITISPGNFKLQ